MKFSVLALTLMISSCSTSYKKTGWGGGYSDMALNKDLFQVSFSGNGYTSGATVQKYFLRRCAEITLENGYDYFSFVEKDGGATKETYGEGTSGTISKNYNGGYDYSEKKEGMTFTKHYREGVIKTYKEGSQPSVSYNAKQMMTNTAD